MPPRKWSRHTYTTVLRYGDTLLMTDRERYIGRNLPDNRMHIVRDGDTLFHLAGEYFKPLPRACGLWWIIADFQPTPIHDPTLRLETGRVLVIPSLQTVMNLIFDTRRVREAVP